MAPTDHPKTDHDSVPSAEVSGPDSSTSPPVTPPTKSSGPDAGSAIRSSLPSPPQSSSYRLSRAPDQQNDQDQRDQLEREPTIDRIARRISPSAAAPRSAPSSNPRSHSASGLPAKTHSSSSSTSSSASSHFPSTLTNKHVAMAKTKTLGHLARSTSSEVDNEVANALASGRSIVSKTDWKEEDADYLVQLIERQFPKGNIIWDWVGQQMANKGFSKNQCRSKWKRIRTKILHGGDPPSKDKDAKYNLRDQEPDELIEEDDDELADNRSQHQDYDRGSEGPGNSDPYRSRAYGSYGSYDRSEGYHYGAEQRDGYRSRSSPAPAPPPSHRSSMSYHPDRQALDHGVVEEDELWSDDDRAHHGPDVSTTRYSQDYQPRERAFQHRRQSSSYHARDEAGDDSLRSLSTIAATPTSFGKIEWKPEDSDFLVHLIETKFASRKVDWAWVSKQMEGRGYDRTQCKSRWWRVQHRQSQSGLGGSMSQPSSRNKQRQSIDQTSIDMDPNGAANGRDDKSVISDEDIVQGADLRSSRQGSTVAQDNISNSSRAKDSEQQRPSSNGLDGLRDADSKERLDDEESQGGQEERGTSPRPARAHEHQKHIEWKEEDSQYMYRLIEKEFPVGNVVWSVIGEKMQSRGYSQTQCMSKWRRHLKNNKLPNDSSKGGASMDFDADAETVSNDSRPIGYRRRGPDDRAVHSDTYADGAKRFRRDGLESRPYDRSHDYKTVDPRSARLVEMEFARYYDSSGKRKRADGEDSQPSQDSGYPHHHKSHSSSHGEHHSHDRDSGRHPRESDSGTASRHRRDHSQSDDIAMAPSAQDADMPDRPVSSAAYRDDGHGSSSAYEPEVQPRRGHHGDTGDFGQDEDAVGVVEEVEEQTKSRREPRSSRSYYDQPPSASEPHRWSDERRGGNSVDYGLAHHHRSSSVSSSYRDRYDSNHPPSGTHGTSEHVSETRPYSQREEPTIDQNKEARHRPHEPEHRGRPIGRSPDRGFMGTSSRPDERDDRRRNEPPRDRYDYPSEGLGGGGKHRSSRQSHDYSNDHEYRSSRRGGHSHRSRQDYERDSDYIDYAYEDDMDWAAGRWEGRDMARLAAAVERQGRRWDALRAQIRIPLLVPYEEMEYDVYDGTRFDPHPSVYRNQHEEPRRSRHYSDRPSSSSTSQSLRHSSSTASRYGSSRGLVPSSGLTTMTERRARVPSETRPRSDHHVPPQTFSGLREPVEVDLTVDNLEKEPLNAEPTTAYPSQRYKRLVDDEAVVDVVSIDDDDDDDDEVSRSDARKTVATEMEGLEGDNHPLGQEQDLESEGNNDVDLPFTIDAIGDRSEEAVRSDTPVEEVAEVTDMEEPVDAESAEETTI
ncbi:hypothetical protein BGZ58_005194 [Dissophora ornata]|nr:hypothetical protein BGZ58_005194 [Dissophora ornata]